MPNRRNTSHTTENNHLPAWMVEELRPDVLLKSASAGVLIYLLEIMLVSSFAALVFSGSLADLLPRGMGFVIASDAVLCLVITLASSYRGSLAVVQDAPSAVTAAGVAAVAAAIPASAGPDAQFATVLMMVIAMTVVTAVVFLVLGSLKLGGLVRFLPYPVMGGFLAGTGWLLATGAVGVMAASTASADLLSPALLLRWLPGIVFGGLLFFAASRWRGPLVMPLGVASAIALFYLSVIITQTPLETLAANGWLIGPFPTSTIWHFPFDRSLLAQVNWEVLGQHWAQVATAAPISVIALLLNVTGLELVIQRDMDPNHELVSAGVGNLGAALAGGLAGYHAISLSTLNHNLAGGKRLPGLVVAALMTLTLVFGAGALNYLPKIVLGALLFFIGLSLLVDWVLRAWSRFPPGEFAVIVLIVGVIATRGFLDGVAVGLVLTILIFVVNYSRVRVIKHTLTGKNYRSRVTRTHAERAVLDAHGDELYILRLQGYLFFGTANRIVEELRGRLDRTGLPYPRAIILDLHQVTGIDSTGLLSFEHLQQLTRERPVRLVITGARPTVRKQFDKAGWCAKPGVIEFCADLDHGVEWGENLLIAGAGCAEAVQALWPVGLDTARLLAHMERRELAAGEYLIRQGDEPDLLFLVESGEITAQLQVPGNEPVRLETMSGGHSVGEVAFYLGIQRTADVVANAPSVVYSLSQGDLERLEVSDPAAASVMHHLIAHLLAERVAHLTRVVGALEQ